MELTAAQARVIACLVEKGATTPDSYPLTTNSLVSACNQSTNRDPVVSFTDRDVDTAMMELREIHLARMVSGVGHRSSKHKHIVGDTLGLDGSELAVLAVLTLRGPQTLNEIAMRTERYLDGPEGDTEVVDAAIDRLVDRPDPLVRRLDRRPGEREPRVEQLWQPRGDAQHPVPLDADLDADIVSLAHDETVGSAGTRDRSDDLADRVATLEASLARQTARLDALLEELGVHDAITPDD